MKTDNSLKTKQFVKKGAMLWFILIAIFLIVQYLTQTAEGISVETKWIRYFKEVNSIMFFFCICSIPFILMFSILLLYAEKAIDKFAASRNRKNQDPK